MTYNKHEAINLINQARSQARVDGFFNFIRRNKKTVTAFLILAVIAVIAFFIFSVTNKSLQKKYSETFHAALILEEQNDYAQALASYDQICKASFVPSGVKSLACLRLAGISYNLGKGDEALAVYKKIASDSFNDDYVQELSGLLASKIIANKSDEKLDKKVIADNLNQIEKFAKHAKVLKDLILEQEAIFLMNVGDYKKSSEVLEKILKSEKAEESLKERASNMLKIVFSKK